MSKEPHPSPAPASRAPGGNALGPALSRLWPDWRADLRSASSLLPALAAALLVATFAQAEHEALAMAEGRFLALEMGLVLASIGWLASRSFLPVLTVGVSVLAALALPALPSRSATVGALLLLGWLLAAVPLARRKTLPRVVDFFFLALGVQVLARPDLLLGPWGPRSAALFLMPMLAALALSLLAERFGAERTLFAFAAVVVLAPGLNVNATLVLLAAAAGVYAAGEQRPLWARGAAALFLLLPLLLRWPSGLLASALGATLLLEGVAPRRRVLPAFIAALVASFSVGEPLGEPLMAFLLASALLPAAFAALGGERLRVAAGVFLVFAAAWLSKDPEGWAAGALLLALSLPVERPVGLAQRVWTLATLALGLALAAFPWLRSEPWVELSRWLAPGPGYFFVIACLLVLLPGLLVERAFPSAPWARSLPLVAAMGGVFLLLLHAVPAPGLLLLEGRPQALVEARPIFRQEIAGFPFREVIVDSQLFHGAEIAAGQEVAELRFLAAGGGELLVLPLRAGDDTADWAAARADVERRPDFRAPSPWLSQVAPAGTFFSGRYRRSFTLEAPIDAVAVELRRAAGLPGPTQVAIYELELRP